jgi:hypothetical protein
MSQDWKAVLRQWWREQRPDLQEAAIVVIEYAGSRTAEVDPHWDSTLPWLEAARSDGFTYGGVLDWVVRLPQEKLEDFYTRAHHRACALQEHLYARVE